MMARFAPRGRPRGSSYTRSVSSPAHDRRARVLAPAVAAALVAEQVASNAGRDALFLTHFDVTTLPWFVAAAAALKPFNVCHVDVSTDYGRKVAEAFHATSFPHTAIIDKTGAVVIHKQPGKVAADQWQSMLVKYQDGQQAVAQTSYYRGAVATSGTVMGTMYPNCPACQRKAMGMSF